MAQIKYNLAGALKAGLSEADVVSYLKGKGHAETDIQNFFAVKKTDFSNVEGGSSTYQKPKGILEQAADFRKQSQTKASQTYKGDRIADALAELEEWTRTGAAGALGGAATIVGGPVAGNAVFSATDEALRYINDRPTGSILTGTQNPIASGIENFAIGEIGGRLISKGATLFKEAIKPGSVIDPAVANLKPTFSGYFDDAARAKRIEDTALTGRVGEALGVDSKAIQARTQAGAKTEVEKFVQTELGQKPFIQHAYQIAPDSVEGAVLRDVINDPVKLKEALITRSIQSPDGAVFKPNNMREGLAAFNLNYLQAKTAIPIGGGEHIINAKAVADDLFHPLNREKYTKLYGAENLQRHQEFFRNIENATRPDGSYGSSMIKRRLLFNSVGIAGPLLTWAQTGSLSTTLMATGGLAAVYIVGKGGKTGISYLLKNQETARVLAAAAKGGALGMSGEAASRLLFREMIGMKVKAVTQDGQEIDAFVNKDGKLEVEP